MTETERAAILKSFYESLTESYSKKDNLTETQFKLAWLLHQSQYKTFNQLITKKEKDQ